jgi:NAD(P)-dependent dehydrogenase (short-subunit alcohol dehydrogenase family)
MTSAWTVVGGGSGGLGRAIAECLAEDGHDIVVCYRSNLAGAEETERAVYAHGRRVRLARVDLSSPEEARAFAAETLAQGEIRGVVYASGPPIPMSLIANTSLETFSQILDSDAKACFNLVQPFLPALRSTQGCVAAVVTPVVDRFSRGDLMSSAPKATVQAIVRGVAREEGRHGVRANCVGAGVVEGDGMFTKLVESGVFTEEGLARAKAETALGRFGSPADIGRAVAFLMSPQAGWITGQTLHVDGGLNV